MSVSWSRVVGSEFERAVPSMRPHPRPYVPLGGPFKFVPSVKRWKDRRGRWTWNPGASLAEIEAARAAHAARYAPRPPGPVRRMTVDDDKPAVKLDGLARLREDFAAGLISKAQVRLLLQGQTEWPRIRDDYLKGRISLEDAIASLPDITDEQARAVPYGRAFLRALVTAGEAMGFAQRGDLEGLRAYLRRQNTSLLKLVGDSQYGLSFPRPPAPQPSHAEVVERVAQRVMVVDGPQGMVLGAAVRTDRPVRVPSLTTLRKRTKPDLIRDLMRAGVADLSGSKEDLARRLREALLAAGVPDSPPARPARTGLEGKTVRELRDMLSARGLRTSGTKPELIARLRANGET